MHVVILCDSSDGATRSYGQGHRRRNQWTRHAKCTEPCCSQLSSHHPERQVLVRDLAVPVCPARPAVRGQTQQIHCAHPRNMRTTVSGVDSQGAPIDFFPLRSETGKQPRASSDRHCATVLDSRVSSIQIWPRPAGLRSLDSSAQAFCESSRTTGQ